MTSLNVGCGGSEFYSRDDGLTTDVSCDIRKPVWAPPNFVLCDAHHLPFDSGIFADIFMVDFIEHVSSPEAILLEVKRCLESKGAFLIVTPNALHISRVLRAMLRGKVLPNEDHIAVWSQAEMENLLRRAKLLGTVSHTTYKQGSKLSRILSFLCPFPALKNRHVVAMGVKDAEV